MASKGIPKMISVGNLDFEVFPNQVFCYLHSHPFSFLFLMFSQIGTSCSIVQLAWMDAVRDGQACRSCVDGGDI